MLDRKVELSATELKEATFQIVKTLFSKETRLHTMGMIQNQLYFQLGATLEEN